MLCYNRNIYSMNIVQQYIDKCGAPETIRHMYKVSVAS